jgi:ABC-type transport system involved in multi-copper enzyme maturation permease subunit
MGLASAPVRRWSGWRLRWSNSRQSWEERLGVFALLAAAAATYWFSGRLPRSQQVVLWTLLVAGVIVVLRRGWLKLFGPVLFYDLIRLARRGRYALLRSLYAIFLLLMLSSVYSSHKAAISGGGGRLRASDMASLAESFFSVFMVAQFLAVGLLTPVYVAGAVCEEKERRTLEFLLATDLRNREIVLSKLASRLANLSLLVLTGLPILSLTQFLGGVDPDLVLAGFAATALTMVGLAGLSTLCSVYSRKARTAIILTYALIAIYFTCSGLVLVLLTAYPTAAGFPLGFGANPITVRDLADGLNAGNPLSALFELGEALSGGQSLANVLPGMLRNYALFHGVLGLVSSAWAVLRLRAVFLHETYGEPQSRRRGRILFLRRRRPAVSNQPILWKEVFTESGLHLNWFGRIIMGLLVAGSFVPIVWMELWRYFYATGATAYHSAEVNVYVRGAGTVVACLALLGIAIRASSSVSGERDRQTWDSLLTTPLGASAILYGKWIGSILSVRWAALWLAVIWVIGLVTDGLSIVAVPFLIAAFLVYAAFLGVLGLWFSVVSRTTLRANLGTLGTTGLLAGGYWFFCATCCFGLFFDVGPGRMFMEEVGQFMLVGLTPPVTLGMLAFTNDEIHRGHDDFKLFSFAVLGLVAWAAGAAALWSVTAARFRAVTGRMNTIPPANPRAYVPSAATPKGQAPAPPPGS